MHVAMNDIKAKINSQLLLFAGAFFPDDPILTLKPIDNSFTFFPLNLYLKD